ncbi:MAG: LON peptidase substrate-binding domain-containing protein [Rhodospirillaceae bacterium]|nr:LON peptidase substrate-binding domain-containing protein [Rhodospirillaceae bacterium]
MRSPTQTRYEDLPEELAVFPLPGALLLPWGRLPLNIFEPRYLNMTLDALKSGRIFGMIQPDQTKLNRARATAEIAGSDSNIITLPTEPPIYSVGCAGRIASFEETDDGRLLVSLKGLIRFRVAEELTGQRGYRRVRPQYGEFQADMQDAPKIDLDRDTLMERLKPYLDAQGMKVNIDVIKNLSDTTLVTSLCMICPFDPREKQALLESPTLQARAETLMTLLQMGVFDASGKPDGPRQ